MPWARVRWSAAFVRGVWRGAEEEEEDEEEEDGDVGARNWCTLLLMPAYVVGAKE
jgi:hypothetical protein